jgi:two-component system KDP operon response regulator KdpE
MTDAMFRVLVVEDDAGLRLLLRTLLEAEGFRVSLAETAARAQVEVRANRPDAALVDLGLPDRDGVALIRDLRRFTRLPIVVLSARTQEIEKIAALDAGADDYVTKPFSAGELLARVRAALRRASPPTPGEGEVLVGPLHVDVARRTARTADGPVHLTPLEFRVLECLLRDRGRVVTQERLLREVWGPDQADTRGLRVYVKSLRDKIEGDPARPRLLLTEPGVGYRLAEGE